jgi:hypothetical protein
VIDPVQLRFVDVLMKIGSELLRRRKIVTERLLDDDAAALDQICLR